ncbi:MerR family transcriptional regulator [Alkaliphilus peptidifermentans]|uniref:MerR family regulatory protein n=1 Tax=Alkaliphilus peptidifermentans DSM 18978 TaxID=1120976 RepID=A0A1G5KR69_9FIRM|nr:MerR family transcriptional regulator [Alkaliphilus peptidifermentans]SCZ03106.1 MerR family regulatory protein [Alkaliphilus peptidifermentans DSM 18978]
MPQYKTIDLARQGNIHPNTVRLYEKMGFLSPVPRGENGYRIYNERHLCQIKIIRCIFDYGWLGREIRAASLKVIELVATWDLDNAIEFTHLYLQMINKDYLSAMETANILEKWTHKDEIHSTGKIHTRKETAQLIGVTEETLRNWDRNGLIKVPRVGSNNSRAYSVSQIERLRIIYMLRQAKYSISSILQSLNQYDKGNIEEVINSLNTPKYEEYQSWVCVGDRWIKGLEDATKGAEEILFLIQEAKEKNI